jgi:cyclic pyranopterin phosphate synthase
MTSLLSRDPINLDQLIRAVSGPEHGGVASFLGVVRNHQDGRAVARLVYTAYEPMADAESARIVAEAEARWPVRIALRHRLGDLAIGDTAVAVAAAGGHRAESFEACRYVIEQLKRRVPIWKQEFYQDGSVAWVGAGELRREEGPAGGEIRPVAGSTPDVVSRPEAPADRPTGRSSDRFGRPLSSLRISVTDRCNMRCRYCMPEEEYVWLPRASILSFEELGRLAGIFAGLGVDKLRLTGGEPLLRHDLPSLVRMLAGQPGIADLALTTNGILLGDQAAALRSAGLTRLTVSLDTLRPERMQQFARSARHGDVLAGIRAAAEAGFRDTKLNAVIIRGYNDDELDDLLEFGRREGLEVRFIEYMDVGGANQWSADEVVSRREMLDRLARRHGPIEPLAENAASRAPADRFRLADGTVFGVIASTTEPFCRTCDRGRLTADGHFFLCLYAGTGLDLRQPLRDGALDAEIAALIRQCWEARADRGAEARAGVAERGALYQLSALRSDPRKEMHTRGG